MKRLTYKPYEIKSFLELMNICYRMGWYAGVAPLFTLTMRGGFELSGRTNECWDCDFIVELAEIYAQPEQGVVNIIYSDSSQKPTLEEFARKESLPGGRFKGATLEEACAKAVAAIRKFREESNVRCAKEP